MISMVGNAWAVSEVRIGKKRSYVFVSCLDGLLSSVAGIGHLVWLECAVVVCRDSRQFFLCGKMYGCREVFDDASYFYLPFLSGLVLFGNGSVLDRFVGL